MVALSCLIVTRRNAEVTTKGFLHQQVKISGSFSAMFAYESASLLLFPVLWIFLRSLGLIWHDRGIPSECHKDHFKD